MKKFYSFLLAFVMLLPLVGCGTQSSPSDDTIPEETTPSVSYAVGDIVDFGDYKWKVLDVKDDKALLLTEELIALDYINLTEESRNAMDNIAEKHPNVFSSLSDYEGWTVFVDDAVFSEGDSFYDSWNALLDNNPNPEVIDPYSLRESISWRDCSLRNKLNNEMSFSEDEWAQILETEVIASTENSEATYDKVFLLSNEQVEQYFPRSEDRGAKATGLSDEMLLHYLKDLHINGKLSGTIVDFVLALPYGGDFYWWTIDATSSDLLGTHTGTEEQLYKIAPAISIGGIRPAIWVSMETT